ncbi:MAG: NAD(P)H-dependent oxidoreductase [Gammaproteobacteria bacterium]
MKSVLIVLCHPDASSFNASLKDVAVQTFADAGYAVEVSDLYADGFDPVEKPEHYRNRQNAGFFSALAEQRHAFETKTLHDDVAREIQRLERADLVILQFPLWWHSQPAMLKGWFDRVFVSGGLYTSSMRYDRGYFRGKRAICSVTSGAPESTFVPNSRGGGKIEQLLWTVNYSLYYMGFSVLPPFLSAGVQGHGFAYQDETQFKEIMDANLSRWSEHLRQIDKVQPIRFYGWSDWDKNGILLPRAK